MIGFLRDQGRLGPEADDGASVLKAAWDWLAASESGVLLLNIEDLWLETDPQNTPNTYDERPNWRRKLRLSLDQIRTNPDFSKALREISQLRKPPGSTL